MEFWKSFSMQLDNYTETMKHKYALQIFFEILAGVLQGVTLALFLFITALDTATLIAIDHHENFGFTL